MTDRNKAEYTIEQVLRATSYDEHKTRATRIANALFPRTRKRVNIGHGRYVQWEDGRYRVFGVGGALDILMITPTLTDALSWNRVVDSEIPALSARLLALKDNDGYEVEEKVNAMFVEIGACVVRADGSVMDTWTTNSKADTPEAKLAAAQNYARREGGKAYRVYRATEAEQ